MYNKHQMVISNNYLKQLKKHQVNCFLHSGLFDGAHNNATLKLNDTFEMQIPYLLQKESRWYNLYSPIREEAKDYFDKHNIHWWKFDSEKDIDGPSTHMVSSQINCLNHLFPLRHQEDEFAIKAILEKATGLQFDSIQPLDIDRDGLIAFEFIHNNALLIGENEENAERGSMCTSIDAMIKGMRGDETWLIPIEWKYGESYEMEDKTCSKRSSRYDHLIETSTQLKVPKTGIPHSQYYQDPCYELMRQTLLVEQIIKQEHPNDNYHFMHLLVVPQGHTELRNYVQQHHIPMLKNPDIFKIIDPQDFLSPLESNKESEKYAKLLTYLHKRYWD